MPICFGDSDLATAFNSPSQRARIVTEAWTAANAYCVACDSNRLLATAANTKARDFVCEHAGHAYELKSSASVHGRKIIDGAFGPMIDRIQDGSAPNLLLMHYGPDWRINKLTVIHHLLLTETVIQQRRPLSATARRAGWIGCNILLGDIPIEGKIEVISDGQFLPKADVRRRYALSERLCTFTPTGRGWAASVLTELRRLGKQRFTIQDAYSMEPQLSAKYPANQNIRPKIRQQLQMLRDLGLLQFESRGQYSFTIPN
jgi:type II restriction enzyme